MAEGLEIVPRRTVDAPRRRRSTEMDVDAVLAAEARDRPRRRARAHQRARLAQREALAGRRGPARRRHRRDLDRERPAHRVAQRRRASRSPACRSARRSRTPCCARADQIEVVDLAPQSLRDRLASGLVYPAERIDAALSNYFRLGNLTALRELALLWLADEVDSALKAYRAEHGIEGTWEARERVVVALTGGPEGETLIRRGARIAARSAGGELLAVHVTSHDGLRRGTRARSPRSARSSSQLGGTFHQVVGEDIPRALVEFARAIDATQLVIGVEPRGRGSPPRFTGPGIGATVIRESGDIDVHIVTHAAAGGRFALPAARRRAQPSSGASLGFAVALVVRAAAHAGCLVAFRTEESITSDVLAYQLLVVVVALIGGIWPALFAAVLSGLTLNFLFVEPLYTVTIADPRHAARPGPLRA